MDKLNIPTSFELFGTTYNVVFNNEKCNDKEQYGDANYSKSLITLSTTAGVDNLSEDKINQTFLHELVHSILDMMHERELSENEKFVDTFANLLNQFNKTAKYDGE